MAFGGGRGRSQRRGADGGNRKSACFHKVLKFLFNYPEMQTVGIPALRGAGAARLGTWETFVFQSFSMFPGARPVIPLAVGGGRGRRQRRDADVDNCKKNIRFYKRLKHFLVNYVEVQTLRNPSLRAAARKC